MPVDVREDGSVPVDSVTTICALPEGHGACVGLSGYSEGPIVATMEDGKRFLITIGADLKGVVTPFDN